MAMPLDYIKSAERWQRYGETYHDEARVYYSDINKACLTIATFLIGFIGVFLQLKPINTDLLINKIIILIAFISLVASIGFGIYLIYRSNKFLNRAGDYYETLSERLHLWISSHNQHTGMEYPKEIYKGITLNEGLNATLSYVQIGFLAFGFLCIFFYLFLRMLSIEPTVATYQGKTAQEWSNLYTSTSRKLNTTLLCFNQPNEKSCSKYETPGWTWGYGGKQSCDRSKVTTVGDIIWYCNNCSIPIPTIKSQ